MNIEVSQQEFLEVIKEVGSDLSIYANTYILGGVKGMPTTHQIGYGEAFRKGINPSYINIADMERRVHRKMIAAVAAIDAALLLEKQFPILAAASFAIAANQIAELIKDWQHGFSASAYLHPSYFEMYPSPVRV